MAADSHPLVEGIDAMSVFHSTRLAAAGAFIGGTAFAVVGALQATNLDWTENAISTPLQHLTTSFFAVGLLAVAPAVVALGRSVTGRLRWSPTAIVVGQAGVA